MGPTINLLIRNKMPFLCTHNCNSQCPYNSFSIRKLTMFFFFLNNTFLFEKSVKFSLIFIEIKKKLTMGNAVVIGLQKLQTVFSSYEQFVGHLCNVFIISNDLYGMALW